MIRSYLKLAFKVLLRRKVFTLISLFGIALTLLVLTVAAALLDHIFGPSAPETRHERTLGIYTMALRGPENNRNGPPGYLFLDRYVRPMTTIEKMSIFTIQTLVVSYWQGQKIESYLKRTDGTFWEILEFQFLEGQPFTHQDDASGNAVAVINATTRQRFFGGQPAVGREISADGQTFRVIGVVPDVPFVGAAPFSDIWVPLSTAKSSNFRQEFMGGCMALLLGRSAADLPKIQAEYAEILKTAQLPDPKMFTVLESGADTLFDSVAREMVGTEGNPARFLRLILLVLMLLFMLLPTVNLVNLNLSRILERSSEIGVRKAFGASSFSLVGQFLVENLILTLIGGLIGFGLAWAVLEGVNASGLVPYSQFALNVRVFLLGLGMAVVFSGLSGGYPAWKMARQHPVEALHGRLS